MMRAHRQERVRRRDCSPSPATRRWAGAPSPTRQTYPRLARSKILAPVDDAKVWSVTCFFVRRDWRRRGVTVDAIEGSGALGRVARRACRRGYPTDTDKDQPGAFVHHGLLPAFQRAGFREVARRSKTRPIVRRKAAAR